MPHTNMVEETLAALVVVDVQEKMLAAIGTSPPEAIIDRIRRLVGAAEALDIPIIYTEQHPEGLGATDARVKAVLASAAGPIQKTTCSCWREESFRTALQKTGREHIIVVGLETHVCIQQTVMDLIRVDYQAYVAVDAVGSRFQSDMDVSIERMRAAGAELSTAESLIFELIERCDHPKFKTILELVK
ncbi:MAG: isochorismatase family protein [Phycisphaerae bacterium]|nr:isochorismatase family protein [Phycisphaerae bacterium]